MCEMKNIFSSIHSEDLGLPLPLLLQLEQVLIAVCKGVLEPADL